MKAVFMLFNGVMFTLDVTTERKHYSDSEAEEAMEYLATKLGASFMYIEEGQDG